MRPKPLGAHSWRTVITPRVPSPVTPMASRRPESHAWVSRCRAWDAYWDEYTQEERKASIRVAEQRAADTVAETAYLGMQVALNEIRGLLRRQEAFVEGDGTAKFMKVREALAVFKTCHDIWRNIHGQSTENVTVTTEIKDMSLEDLDAHIAKLEKLGK